MLLMKKKIQVKLADKVRIPQRAVLPIIRYFSCNFLRDCGMIFQMSLFLPGGVFNMIWNKANLRLLLIQGRWYCARYISVHTSTFLETQMCVSFSVQVRDNPEDRWHFLKLEKQPCLRKPAFLVSKKKTKDSFGYGSIFKGSVCGTVSYCSLSWLTYILLSCFGSLPNAMAPCLPVQPELAAKMGSPGIRAAGSGAFSGAN